MHYLLSATTPPSSVKIRANTLDAKALISEHAGLELWCPVSKRGFPVTADRVLEVVGRTLGASPPKAIRDTYSVEQFLREVVADHPDLCAVILRKRRTRFDLGNASGEIARVDVAGKRFQTVAVEDEDAACVQLQISRLGMEDYVNINYARAIAAVLRGANPWDAD